MPPAPTTFALFLVSLLVCILASLPVTSAQDAAPAASSSPYPTPSPPPAPPPTPSPPPPTLPGSISFPEPVPYPTPPVPSTANTSSLITTVGDSLPANVTASRNSTASACANATTTTTFHPLVPTPPSTMPDVRNATVLPNWVPNSTVLPPPTSSSSLPPDPSSAPPIVPATTDPVAFAYPNARTLERRHAHVTLSRPLDVAADLYLANLNHTDTSRPYLCLLAAAVPPGTLRVRFRTRGIANLPSGGGYVVFFADAAAAAGFEGGYRLARHEAMLMPTDAEVLVTSDPFIVLGRGDSGAHARIISTRAGRSVAAAAGFGIALLTTILL
ncbi:uncharacterized protein LOC62_06G008091 [Vanrija pseudolonga]|uniref:Uncharacterized protein n=1 Tax=Vanrija pseudolonga TaxID=143232 RepID=A0AAF0YEV9_9TREE|nr:hypothetical protein LOC62_06G008091 [Vanrija pseudolonga]